MKKSLLAAVATISLFAAAPSAEAAVSFSYSNFGYTPYYNVAVSDGYWGRPYYYTPTYPVYYRTPYYAPRTVYYDRPYHRYHRHGGHRGHWR